MSSDLVRGKFTFQVVDLHNKERDKNSICQKIFTSINDKYKTKVYYIAKVVNKASMDKKVHFN